MRKESKFDQEMKRYSFHGDCVRLLEGEGIVLWISDFFQCTEKVMVTDKLEMYKIEITSI